MHIYPFLAKILNKLHLLQSFNGSAKIIINGKKIDVPLLGRLGYDNLNLSEPWMSDMLIALRPLFNGHFIDVGVNIGQTLLKAQPELQNTGQRSNLTITSQAFQRNWVSVWSSL